MEPQRDFSFERMGGFLRRFLILVGVLATGCVVFFFIFGDGHDFLKNNSAIALSALQEAFGISSGENFMEIAMTSSSLKNDIVDNTIIVSTEDNAEVKSKNDNTSGSGIGLSQDNNSKPKTKNVSSITTSLAFSKGDSLMSASSGDSVLEMDDLGVISDGGGVITSSLISITTSSVVSVKNKTSSKKTSKKACSFPSINNPILSRAIILNEIAWMGSPARNGESSTGASNNEWIELKNRGTSTISLSGWEILDATKKIAIVFGDADSVASSSFYLLERTDDNSVSNITADKIYSGSLPNTGDKIGIFDSDCNLVDFLDASDGWPGGDNGTKRTLERNRDDFGWHTSIDLGGTPKAENSAGSWTNSSSTISAITSSSSYMVSTTSSILAVPKYVVSVVVSGDGVGKIVSNPVGINCNTNCITPYSAGQIVTLHAVPGVGVSFSGWSGPCSGTTDCVFAVTGYVSATALFHGMKAITEASIVSNDDYENNLLSSTVENFSSSTEDASQSSSSLMVATTSDNVQTPVVGHLVIAAVQIAGASSSNDFVKIYNPSNNAVNIGGWKLRKKSSTGTDYSLKEISTGDIVPAGGYFMWANSANGFSVLINADVSSTETLSANNSVALFDASGATVDAVAWGNGVNQYGESMPYSTNPAASQILARLFQNGTIVDTGNNAVDFILQ